MNLRTLLGIAIIVLVGLVTQRVESTADICDTPKCLQEAAKLIDYIDTNANPCDDFYQFACGKFLKNAHGNEKLTPWDDLADRYKYESLEIYQEDIGEDEHKMVKAAKKLYRACMDEEQIKIDFVRSVRKVLHEIGGWPILEESFWYEEDFNWLNATYKLRQLGYPFSAFLEVQVEEDEDRHSVKIQTYMQRYNLNEDRETIAKVAALLGAQNEQNVLKELTDTYDAFKDIEQFQFSGYPSYTRQTVAEIQKSDGVIDWLEFINAIVGPKAQLSKTDYVRFPKDQYLSRMIALLSKVPKRAQANYLAWEVIKPIVHFVIDSKDRYSDVQETRAEFCSKVTLRTFTSIAPNPMDVMLLRRYVPQDKKTKIDDMISKIKSVSVQALSKVEWLSDDLKQQVIKQMETFNVYVELSGNYFEDKLLDDADVDMMEMEDDATFFELLAQAHRNRESESFIKLNKKITRELDNDKHGKKTSRSFNFGRLDIPFVQCEGWFFHENRPDYLNYAALGFTISRQVMERVWRAIKDDNIATKQCILLGMNNSTLSYEDTEEMAYEAIKLSLGEQISRAAYEEWTKEHGNEPKLVATQYTPNQLFWITLGTASCEAVGASDLYGMKHKVGRQQRNSDVVNESLRLHPTFAKDFTCPVNSRLNPSNKCKAL